MSIRTILVSLDGTETTSVTLETAFLLVRRLGIHATVLHVRTDPLAAAVPPIGEGVTARTADNIAIASEREADERAGRARALFEDSCRRHGIAIVGPDAYSDVAAASWMEKLGRKDKVMGRMGRVHDLIVVGRPTHPDDIASSMTIYALFDTGRPVLVVPPTMPATVGERIAIAWDGSPECARAVGGATAFMPQASMVTVLTAETIRTPASVVPELATYLRRHGVATETHVIDHLGKRELGGPALLAAAKGTDADLVVMGAHRSEGLRKLALGKATREVLETTGIPVLMSH